MLLAGLAAGCTPQQALLASVVPEGTMSVLLSHAQRVQDANRRQIVSYEQARDWPGLARFAEENIKRDPHTPDWHLVAGYAYGQQSQHERAAAAYAEAVRLEPDVALAWRLLAESYRAAGQPRRAVNALGNALLARPDDVHLYWLLGESESDLGQWPRAIAAYRAATRLDGRHLPSWRGLERAYGESGRLDDAREAQRTVEGLAAQTSGAPPARDRRSPGGRD